MAATGLEVLLLGRVQAAMELSAAEQCPWWACLFRCIHSADLQLVAMGSAAAAAEKPEPLGQPVYNTCASSAFRFSAGLVGFARRVFSWQRWVGAALMVVGVVLVSQFPGETVEAVRQHQAKQAALAAAAAAAADSMHLDTAAAGVGLNIANVTGNAAGSSSSSSSSNLGRRLAAMELGNLWNAKSATPSFAGVAAAGLAGQRRIGDSASSAIAAASWLSLAAQDSVERPPDAAVHWQDRV
jgi:putative Mn2+ efflux pump MntP